MKNLVFALAVIGLSAGAAKAEDDVPTYQMLYWQVQPGNGAEYYGDSASYAKLYATVDGVTVGNEMRFLSSGYGPADGGSWGTELTSWNGGNLMGVSFYVELLNESGSSLVTSEGVTYENLLAGGYLNVVYSGSKPPISDTSVWNATFAVPEPTTGLLMLLGFAGLALRRKRA